MMKQDNGREECSTMLALKRMENAEMKMKQKKLIKENDKWETMLRELVDDDNMLIYVPEPEYHGEAGPIACAAQNLKYMVIEMLIERGEADWIPGIEYRKAKGIEYLEEHVSTRLLVRTLFHRMNDRMESKHVAGPDTGPFDFMVDTYSHNVLLGQLPAYLSGRIDKIRGSEYVMHLIFVAGIRSAGHRRRMLRLLLFVVQVMREKKLVRIEDHPGVLSVVKAEEKRIMANVLNAVPTVTGVIGQFTCGYHDELHDGLTYIESGKGGLHLYSYIAEDHDGVELWIRRSDDTCIITVRPSALSYFWLEIVFSKSLLVEYLKTGVSSPLEYRCGQGRSWDIRIKSYDVDQVIPCVKVHVEEDYDAKGVYTDHISFNTPSFVRSEFDFEFYVSHLNEWEQSEPEPASYRQYAYRKRKWMAIYQAMFPDYVQMDTPRFKKEPAYTREMREKMKQVDKWLKEGFKPGEDEFPDKDYFILPSSGGEETSDGQQEVDDLLTCLDNQKNGRFNTTCIREPRSALTAMDLPSFPGNASNIEMEHYVQLGVITNAFREKYGFYKGKDHAEAIVRLKEYFNEGGNVFATSRAINQEKNTITVAHDNDPSYRPEISKGLKLYIQEATPFVREYVLDMEGIDAGIRKEILAYVEWLSSLA